jgi:hypothetical protein
VLPLVAAAPADPDPAVPVGFVAVLPLVLLEGWEPDEPDICALVRMKSGAVEVAAPVVPLVPVAPEVAPVARCTHPVTVT